jgi:hypothetical protein
VGAAVAKQLSAANIDALASKLKKQINELKKQHVVVGLPFKAGAHADANMSLSDLGHAMESGSVGANRPPRPFLLPSVKLNKAKYIKLLGKVAVDVVAGKNKAITVYRLVGNVASNDVKQYIASGSFAPLSPVTIARKGSSKPLIDTGQLRQSITYEVRGD